MSWLDVLLLVGVMFILGVLILPISSARDRCGSPRTRCLSNQKQTALAALTWAIERDGRFPWQPLPGTNLATPDLARHFAVLSNELVVTEVLCCPADKERNRRGHAAFATLQSNDISYFVVADTAIGNESGILFGDRDVRGLEGKTRCSVAGVLAPALTAQSAWENKFHPRGGNVAMADGSAQMMTSDELRATAATNSSSCRVSHLLVP